MRTGGGFGEADPAPVPTRNRGFGDMSGFIMACQTGNMAGVDMCLRHGANPNAVDSKGVSFLFTIQHFT